MGRVRIEAKRKITAVCLSVCLSACPGGFCAWGAVFLKQTAMEELEGLMAEQADEPGIEDEEEVQAVIDEFLEAMEMVPGKAEQAEVVTPELEPIVTDRGVEYHLPNGEWFVSSVPNGMITGEPVEFYPPDNGLSVVRIGDGEPAMQEQGRFTKPGSYQIQMLCFSPLSDSQADSKAYEVSFFFTILEEEESHLGVVQAPEGFIISDVRRNGKKQQEDGGRWVFLEGDGIFEIDYADEKTGAKKFETRLVRDTVAPFLNFSQNMEDGRAEAPLSFQPSEPDCVVMVRYNGISGYASVNTLTVPGIYELSVADKAGNSRSYLVRLEQVYKLFDKRAVIIAVIFLAGVAVWMAGLRRSMRVL